MPQTHIDRCRLSIPMRLVHGADAPAHVYLTFRRSALLVELLDIPARSPEEEQGLITLSLRDVDARGLGLAPDDFADGVAVCHAPADETAIGWSCEPVLISGIDAGGNTALILDERDAARWLA